MPPKEKRDVRTPHDSDEEIDLNDLIQEIALLKARNIEQEEVIELLSQANAQKDAIIDELKLRVSLALQHRTEEAHAQRQVQPVVPANPAVGQRRQREEPVVAEHIPTKEEWAAFDAQIERETGLNPALLGARNPRGFNPNFGLQRRQINQDALRLAQQQDPKLE